VADRPPPGLKSIRTLREDRARGRYARPTTTLLLVAVVGVTLTLIAYNLFATRSLESRRNALLEKQRAVQMTLGVEWDSLRDRLEAAALGASGPYQGDFIDRANVTSFVADDFRGHPGLYLRLRLEDARSPEKLRAATEMSQRDGFAACFLHDTSSSVDHDGGPFGEQPWNLRRAYDSTKILTPRWVDDVKTTDDDLRLRAFEKQYEHAVQDDIPVAARIVKQAEYLLLVLDEDGSDGAPLADGGAAGETADRQVQATTHEARVELLDLRGPRAGNAIFRLRRNAESSFVMASEGADLSPEMRLALQRQVNNCGLANEITKALATK
jgi:hypothetical protein